MRRYRRMREYGDQHADCRDALENWFKVAQKADWSNLIEVQAVFPKAEAVGKAISRNEATTTGN
jgi:mRNA interferase HigB